jgi:putative endopeptidase
MHFAGASLALALTACAATPKPEAAAPPVAAPAPKPAPKLGSFGFDAAGMNKAIRPGDDFFRYSGGAWMEKEQMPSDRVRWGTFDQLRAKADDETRALIEELAAKPNAQGGVEQQIGAFYAAFLDVDAIDAKATTPVQPLLDEIAGLKSFEQAMVFGSRPGVAVSLPIFAGVTIDDKNPDRYVVFVTHSGLGLPDRDYYLKADKQFADIRKEYEAHIARMLGLAGIADGARKAKAILAFETEIAKLHWPREQRREREKTYNLKTKAELKAMAPALPWDVMLATARLDVNDAYVVNELSAMAPLARLSRRTPLSTWKAYFSYHLLSQNASVLPKAIDAENFAFYGTTLNGQPEQRARWKRGVQAVNGALGEAIGQVYVQRHFSPEAKAEMVRLVENVRTAYAQRIKALQWMSPETKVAALEKLASFRPKIGYPDKWRDYSGLDVVAGDAFGNAQRAAVFEWNREVERLSRPTDRDEWFMSPQTVNAYYNPTFNEIVFPAAILQPPFFDLHADPAVNYGAIGGVIGHEMGHGFDDQGAKSDAKGVLRTWWNEKDVAAFSKLGDKLVAQYSAYEPLPGMKLNGRLGLGENIGDNGGLQVAHEAYKLSLAGQTAPVIDGFTGDQRFFHGWGQVWRTLYREQALRNQIITGPHSPGEFRANGVVRNMDAWYAAFDVKAGDKLYLPPEERVKIW